MFQTLLSFNPCAERILYLIGYNHSSIIIASSSMGTYNIEIGSNLAAIFEKFAGFKFREFRGQ